MKNDSRIAVLLRQKELLFWVALILLGLFGILLMSYLTPNGMGLVNDSVAYIAGARNLVAGLGYSRISGDGSPLPTTHFPPLFSLTLIATTMLTGLETIRAARVVNLLLFGGNVILTGIAARKISSSKVLALVGALVFLISDPFLRIHSFALSEPLYLFLSYLAFLSLAHYYSMRPTSIRTRWGWLAAAGFFCSLGYITRYIGVSLYAAVAAAILFLSSGWKKRFQQGLLFLVFSLPAPLVWSTRNILVSGNAANRPFDWHPPSQDRLYEGLNNLWSWLLPDSSGNLAPELPKLEIVTYILIGLIFAGLSLLTYRYIIRRNKSAPINECGTPVNKIEHWMKGSIEYTLVFGWYGLIYLFLLVFAMTYFDSATTFEHRMLAPFYVTLLLLGIGLLSLMWKRPSGGWKLATALLCLVMLGSLAKNSINTVNELHSAGQGFASGRWRNSETMEAVRHLPPSKIFSNKITGLYLLANRPAYIIPWRFVPDLSLPDPTFDEGVAEYRRQVLNKEAVVVIFDYETAIREDDIRVINLTQGLPIMGMYPDGAIFGVLDFNE